MTNKELINFFDDNEEFLEFDNIPLERKLSTRKDLNAFLILERLVPGKTDDIISGAEHDQIWLDVSLEDLKDASETDLLDLLRCGVMYSEESLSMFG